MISWVASSRFALKELLIKGAGFEAMLLVVVYDFLDVRSHFDFLTFLSVVCSLFHSLPSHISVIQRLYVKQDNHKVDIQKCCID